MFFSQFQIKGLPEDIHHSEILLTKKYS